MSKYPQAPGHNKVDTSIEAAESMEKSSATLRTRVLNILGGADFPFVYPMT